MGKPGKHRRTRRQRWLAARRRRRDRGYATAELAVALPSLVLLLLGAVWILQAVGQQAACFEAARLGARAAARGDPASGVTTLVARAAPPGARIESSRGAGLVVVRVTVAVRPVGVLRSLLPAVTVRGTATAEAESGVAGDPAGAAEAVLDQRRRR